MPWMSQSDYARHRSQEGLPGGTPSAVHYAIKSGRIRVDPDTSMIDSEMADIEWGENTSPIEGRAGMEARGIRFSSWKANKAEAIKPSTSPEEAELGTSKFDFNTSKAMKEHYLAGIAKMDHDEREGKLIPSDVVGKALFETGHIVRSGHADIVAQLAPELASETSINKVESILKKALDHLDNRFADHIEKLSETMLVSEQPDES